MSFRAELRRRQLLGLALALASCREAPARDTARADPLERLPAGGERPNALVLGITPSSGPTTHELLRPLIDYLATKLPEVAFSAVTAPDYDGLAPMLDDRRIDIGIFSPLSYVHARASLKGVPLATVTRRGSPTYLGYLVVRQSDAAQRIEDLRGRSIAWVERSSTSGYLYARELLRHKGVADVDSFFRRATFAGSHERAVRALREGKVDVAAVAAPFADPGPINRLAGQRGEPEEPLRVIAKTRRIPLDCVLVRNDLPRELAAELRAALLAIDRDEAASLALQKSWGMSGFVPPLESDYDAVEEVLRASE